MKAKNPHGEGYVEVGFPSGPDVKFWGKRCRDCGSSCGGCFSGPGLPEPCVMPGSVCPGCSGQNIELVEVPRKDHPAERAP